MKIFITGATGYIGGSIAATMRGAGHEVVGLVRSDERANQAIAKGIKPIMGSLDVLMFWPVPRRAPRP